MVPAHTEECPDNLCGFCTCVNVASSQCELDGSAWQMVHLGREGVRLRSHQLMQSDPSALLPVTEIYHTQLGVALDFCLTLKH